jgi:Domain of unknown function (DUF4190)
MTAIPPRESDGSTGRPPQWPHPDVMLAHGNGHPMLVPTPRNRLAVASLIVSCAGLLAGVAFAIAPITGLILGIVARSQIRRDPRSQGRGIALGGVIVGAIGSAWWIWFWVISISTNFGGH